MDEAGETVVATRLASLATVGQPANHEAVLFWWLELVALRLRVEGRGMAHRPPSC